MLVIFAVSFICWVLMWLSGSSAKSPSAIIYYITVGISIFGYVVLFGIAPIVFETALFAMLIWSLFTAFISLLCSVLYIILSKRALIIFKRFYIIAEWLLSGCRTDEKSEDSPKLYSDM